MTPATPSVTGARVRASDCRQHRRALLSALVPFGIFLTLGFGLRSSVLSGPTAAASVDAADFARTPITSAQAWRSAERVGVSLTGQDVDVRETNPLRAYSPSQKDPVRFWEIVCDMGASPYSLRISAETGEIVTVNSLAVRPANFEPAENVWSERDAEERARRYLRMIRSDGDSRWHSHQNIIAASEANPGITQGAWTFHFRIKDEQGRKRLAVVSVDARTGTLLNAMIPSLAASDANTTAAAAASASRPRRAGTSIPRA